MSVPSYGELGKSARNVFCTGYAYERGKVEFSAPLLENLGLHTEASVDLRSFLAKGSLLLKYRTPNYGQFSGKYAYDGPLVGEYLLDNVLAENVSVVAGYSLNLADSFHSAKFGAQYHNSLLHACCSLTKDLDRSVDLLGSVVLKLQNMLFGYQIGYNGNTSKITENNLGLTFQEDRLMVHLRCIRIPREYGFSAHYRVNDKLDVAIDGKTANDGDSRLWFTGAGFAYSLDEQCKLRMKLDKNLQLGTCLQLRLPEKLLLTLAFNIDLAKPASGGHKVGMGLGIDY